MAGRTNNTSATNGTNKNSTKSTGAKSTTAATATKTVTAPSVIEDELNLDTKVTVKNLAGWDVTFARKHEGTGAVIVTKEGKQRLSRNEIQAQVNDGNKLFVGVGNGKHATIYIEDEATRKWVGFEEDGVPQEVFTDKLVQDLFDMSQSDFEAKLPIYIVTRAEKYALIEAIKRLGFNDYRKIIFASNYTGYKI